MHENCFQFFLWVSGHHKRNWSQFTYARFLGVNKVFYGRCKNCEYVNNFVVYDYFFNLTLQKCAINISKNLLRTEPFHELPCCIFFLLHGFEINLYLRNSFCTNTSLNRTTPWCWTLSLSSHLTLTMLCLWRKPL